MKRIIRSILLMSASLSLLSCDITETLSFEEFIPDIISEIVPEPEDIQYEDVYYNDLFQEARDNAARATEAYAGKYIRFMAKIYNIPSSGESFSVGDGDIQCSIDSSLKETLLSCDKNDYVMVSGRVESLSGYSMSLSVNILERISPFTYGSSAFGMSYEEIRDCEKNKETSSQKGMLYFQWNGGNDEYGCTPTNIIYDFAYSGMRKITVSYRDVNSSVYSSLIRKFEEKFGVTGITDDMPEADLKRTLFKTEKVYINLGYFTDSQSISLSFLDPTEYSFSD